MTISLQVLEERVAHERELRVLHEHTTAHALLLQAAEYERRLQILNHSHERQSELLATFLTRERFDQYVSEHTKWGNTQTEGIDDKLDAFNTWRAEERGARSRQGAILAVIFSIAIALLKFVPQGFGISQ